jgi:formamidopyrimidine-DNA glycosylase
VPELPEVETVRRTLEKLVGERITSMAVGRKGLHMARKPPRGALRKLIGARITGLRRIGKYLLVDTDRPQSILAHLGMTGRLRIHRKGDPRANHTHLVIGFGERELRFVDPRRFGQLDVVTRPNEREHVGLAVLGPDPLTDGLDTRTLFTIAKQRKVTLKALVLDQGVIAGMGNIYASEALWRAKLRPTTRSNRLTSQSTAKLAAAVREVLSRALDHNGTTFSDFVDADGREGDNEEYLWVYGREGMPCRRCRTSIRKSVQQGRATYYCPTCQTP